MSWYNLDKDKNPVPVDIFSPDYRPLKLEERVVCQEEIFAIRGSRPGHERLSTVFLGLDHGWGNDRPVLWETMSFPEESWSENKFARYCSYPEAVEGHKRLRKELTRELYFQIWKALIPTVLFLALIISLSQVRP